MKPYFELFFNNESIFVFDKLNVYILFFINFLPFSEKDEIFDDNSL